MLLSIVDIKGRDRCEVIREDERREAERGEGEKEEEER